MTVQLEARNSSLEDLERILRHQDAMKLDAVVPATKIRSKDGLFHVEGMGTSAPDTVEEITRGISSTGVFRLTDIAHGHVSEKLGVPLAYARKMHSTRTDLYDSNVNGWLHGRSKRTRDLEVQVIHPADTRRFLIRTFVDPDGGPGVMRAFLSDTFGRIDHLDTLVTFLEVIRESAPDAEVVVTNLSERRMYVRVAVPSLFFYASRLLADYRTPIEPRWTPRQGRPQRGDILFAGMTFGNSETGKGRFLLAPTATVCTCGNGATVTKDMISKVHLGARIDEGVVKWSEETHQKNLELVQSMTRDATKTFLSKDYWEAQIAEIERKAEVPLPEGAAPEVVEIVTKRLSFSDDTARLVLDHFIRGGQPTAGGIFQAVTSAAQIVSSPDEGYELENVALQALDIAAAAATR